MIARVHSQDWVSNLRDIALPIRELAGGQLTTISQGRQLPRALRLFACSWAGATTLLYQPGAEFWMLAFLRRLTFCRAPLVLVDVVFTPAKGGLRSRLGTAFRGWAWRSVDLFLVHQRDVDAVCHIYDLDWRRFRYVPFKVNSIETIANRRFEDGGYVVTGGKSRRDLPTFCKAMQGTKYRGVIVLPVMSDIRSNDSLLDESLVPGTVDVRRDVTSDHDWFELMANASIVAICIARGSISPSGVSVYLLAMAMGKAVIVTEGCATRGILADGEQAFIVPPEDPPALRAAIERLMEDPQLRRELAERGRRYAVSLGGEAQLLERLVAATVDAFPQVAARPSSGPHSFASLE